MRRSSILIILACSAMANAQAPVQPGPPVSAPVKSAAAGKEDKLICRTTSEIGSLIATNKVCHTRREWTQINEDLRIRGPVGNCAGSSQGGSCL